MYPAAFPSSPPLPGAGSRGTAVHVPTARPTSHPLHVDDHTSDAQWLTNHWTTAFKLWLNSQNSPNTQRAYRQAWDLFLPFTSKLPWEIIKADVALWIDHLRTQRLSPETINLRLAALSSFFTYVTQTYTLLDPAGREQPLHHFNPARAVPRPKTSPYNKARSFTVDQARAFLHAIPRWTLQGKRDYALFLAYLATGRRNTEIRTLQWKDFEIKGSILSKSEGPTLKWGDIETAGFVQSEREGSPNLSNPESISYRWTGKGRTRRDELPQSAWNAILDYLSAADRFASISPSDFIFTALSRNAQYLPNVRDNSLVSAPLAPHMVNRLIKKYLCRANIDSNNITVHSLRHTSAMLRKQAGADLASISSFLGHSNYSVTQVYLNHRENRPDAAWLKVAALLGV